jgi:adenylate kinase family enzyme
MKRVVVIGRGGAGKSTLAVRLGELTGLRVIHLDDLFWQPDLVTTPSDRWTALQRELVQEPTWIMDGDLGPHDVLPVRLEAADTVILVDLSLVRCAWRAMRRSRERADFWRWLLTYRRRSRPLVMEAIATHAAGADVHVLRTPRAVRRFIETTGNVRRGG